MYGLEGTGESIGLLFPNLVGRKAWSAAPIDPLLVPCFETGALAGGVVRIRHSVTNHFGDLTCPQPFNVRQCSDMRHDE